MSRALATVNYGNVLTENSRESMKSACRIWSCDYLELNENSVPKHPRLSPPAMKTMAFMVSDYDELFLLDADTVVAGHCPSPFETFPNQDELVVVKDRSTYDCQRIEFDKIAERLPGLNCPLDHARYWNSGVILARRDAHEAMFAMSHALALVPMGLAWCDQSLFVISTMLLGLKINFVNEAWNFLSLGRVGNCSALTPDGPVLIAHGAGDPSRIEWLNTIQWK